MKKYVYWILVGMLIFGCSTEKSHAQMKDLVSKTLNIGMSVPDDFKTVTNDAETFAAYNKDISLSIRPFSLPRLTLDNMTTELITHAEALGYKNLSNAETIELNGFQGCYAIGKYNREGALVILLMNQRTKQNLYITLTYATGFEKTALYVANSFYVNN